MPQGLDAAQALNLGCHCHTLSPQLLRDQLETDPSLVGMVNDLELTHPHLFSSTVVFLSQQMGQRITQLINAIERVVALPAYQAQALLRAPEIARHPVNTAGVFMGYDFHLGIEGPQLIEVNTNAGGAFLNAALAHAQHACCQPMAWAFSWEAPSRQVIDQTFVDMFANEWRLQRGHQTWQRLIIVDDDPSQQYLAPEFQLAKQLFEHHGVSTCIADPRELMWREGHLWHQGQRVEMVYNRLTDFYLTEPAHQALRQAFEADAIVMTPHPRAHALYADKRNLIGLSQSDVLRSWGVNEADQALLMSSIPHTQSVTPAEADALWAQRRHLFFKPVAGYGSKATYRGDKLTRKVWSDILAGDFVAQALVPPSHRVAQVDGVIKQLKFDVRAYTYRGQVQLLAARMYEGQTTNFRTPGGGFAPVFLLGDGLRASLQPSQGCP